MPHKRFRYRDLDELRKDVEALGLDIPVGTEDTSILFEPIRVGGRTLSNRFAVQPMEGFDADDDGSPGALALRRYERYAGGGSSLIWFEATAVLREARSNPGQLWLHDGSVGAFEKLVEPYAAGGAGGHRTRGAPGAPAHALRPLQQARRAAAAPDRPPLRRARPAGTDPGGLSRGHGRVPGPAAGHLRGSGHARGAGRLRRRGRQELPPLPGLRAAGLAHARGAVRRLASRTARACSARPPGGSPARCRASSSPRA